MNLAVSLHAATDELRDRLVPLNRRYPLDELLAACDDYVSRRRRKLFFEYVVLAGVNDGDDQVAALARRLRRPLYHLNLIAYNETGGEFARPRARELAAFREKLAAAGVACTVRRSPGGEIEAACGQLALRSRDDAVGAASERPSGRARTGGRSRSVAAVALGLDEDVAHDLLDARLGDGDLLGRAASGRAVLTMPVRYTTRSRTVTLKSEPVERRRLREPAQDVGADRRVGDRRPCATATVIAAASVVAAARGRSALHRGSVTVAPGRGLSVERRRSRSATAGVCSRRAPDASRRRRRRAPRRP